MLGTDILVRHGTSLIGCNLKYLFGSGCKGQHLPDCHHSSSGGDCLLDARCQFIKIHTHAAHHCHSYAITLFYQAQKKVLGSNIVISEPHRFLTGNLHYFFDSICKHSVHYLYSFYCESNRLRARIAVRTRRFPFSPSLCKQFSNHISSDLCHLPVIHSLVEKHLNMSRHGQHSNTV